MATDEILGPNTKLEFTWLDYGLFSSMLLSSALIGVYFGFIKKQSSANDYLLGGKEMSVFPISMSLIASAISGITLLAVPADIYKYGVAYWFGGPMLVLSTIIAYYFCIPVFYDLQITSTYEYLERRFDATVRAYASATFTLTMFLFLPIVIYIPALALSQATSFNVHSITPIICGVCVFYTTFGGLKAVVWTDALQLVLMIGTIILILILSLVSVGFGNIWQKSGEYGRLNIDSSFDITKRDTLWTGILGTFFGWFSYVASNQGFMQKCIALPNYGAVRNALIIFSIGTGSIILFAAYCGLMMFTRYYDCDPLTSGKIDQADQLLPYFIMDVGRVIPGLPGLFTAGIFSAALSTLSACINCLSATIYEDFISRYVKRDTSDQTISTYLKILAVIIGIICTGLVFFVPYFGGLMALSFSFNGISGGTMIGIFVCGMFFPSINAKGALWGGITSTAIMIWIVVGAQYYKITGKMEYPNLPLMTHGCQNFTSIVEETTAKSQVMLPEDEPLAIYQISFYYYILIGMLLVIIVALIISKFTPQYNKPISKKYFSPLVRNLIDEADAPPDYFDLQEKLEGKKFNDEKIKLAEF